MQEADDPQPYVKDALTGAYARAAFAPRLQEELERATRCGEMLSLAVVDLDHFKSINDAYGHRRGDQTLQACAHLMQAAIRSTDLLFRYGGDEFLILLPNTSGSAAVTITERTLATLQETPLPGTPPLTLSMSIGVATFPIEATTADELFELADRRVYAAKRRGRAQVVVDDSGLMPEQREPSRLIERDAALALLQTFFDQLDKQSRGLLTISGPSGMGRTRFLNAVAQVSQLRGYGIRLLRGQRSLSGRPYGVLGTDRWPELSDDNIAADAVAEALQRAQTVSDQVGLLILVDDFPLLDRATRSLLHEIVRSPRLSRVALIASTTYEYASFLLPFAASVLLAIDLHPLSPAGVQLWMREALHWEAPDSVVTWLYRQTHGVPARLHTRLRSSIERGVLLRAADGWRVRDDVLTVEQGNGDEWPVPPSLPIPLTSFEGRAHDLDQLKSLLAIHRLVTLVGMGGVGKTRLAIEVGIEIAGDIADGVYFVDLGPVADSNGVMPAIAQVLGVRETTSRSLDASIYAVLRDKQLLLILDNIEHLQASGPQIATLIASVPAIRLLVTSREVLQLAGEVVYGVAPLEAPDLSNQITPEQALQNDAIRLFVERAQAADPAFTLTRANTPLVAAICVRLDGLPLALELAATRVRLLPIQALLERLDHRLQALASGPRDRPLRQQTLRATLNWSFDLLPPDEQRLFARLAIFAGDFSIAAAEAVLATCAAPGDSILDGLQALVDKSLLQRRIGLGAEPQLAMLETVREYALEQLNARNELHLLGHAHAKYYLALAVQAEPALRGAEQRVWLERLAVSQPNLRAAYRWYCEQRDATMQLRFVAALSRFWFLRGHFAEWTASFAELPIADELSSPDAQRARARVLLERAIRARYESDEATATTLGRSSLALYTALDDGWGRAASLVVVGAAECRAGAAADGWSHLQESVQRARTIGDRWLLAWALLNLGQVPLDRGDFAAAQALHQEALGLSRDVGDPWLLAWVVLDLGRAALLQGDLPQAAKHFDESLAIRRDLGDLLGMAWALWGLGIVAWNQGSYDAARTWNTERLHIEETLGNPHGIASARMWLGQLAWAQEKGDEARSQFTASLRLGRDAGNNEVIVTSLLGLGRVDLADGDIARANACFSESLALCRTIELSGGIAASLLCLGQVASTQGNLSLALAYFQESIHIWQGLGNLPGVAACFEGLAGVMSSTPNAADHRQGVRLLAVATMLREKVGVVMPPEERIAYEHAVASLRIQIDSQLWTMLWAEGQALTMEQAIRDGCALQLD